MLADFVKIVQDLLPASIQEIAKRGQRTPYLFFLMVFCLALTALKQSFGQLIKFIPCCKEKDDPDQTGHSYRKLTKNQTDIVKSYDIKRNRKYGPMLHELEQINTDSQSKGMFTLPKMSIPLPKPEVVIPIAPEPEPEKKIEEVVEEVEKEPEVVQEKEIVVEKEDTVIESGPDDEDLINLTKEDDEKPALLMPRPSLQLAAGKLLNVGNFVGGDWIDIGTKEEVLNMAKPKSPSKYKRKVRAPSPAL